MEFYNAASRLYVLHFIEVAEMGSHRVLYFWLNLAVGKRGGAPDKQVGRMIVAVQNCWRWMKTICDGPSSRVCARTSIISI